MIDVSKYIGKPYRKNCRDGSGYDCYTLFLAIQRDLGKDLIDLGCDSGLENIRKEEIEKHKKLYPFKRIEKPIEGCAVVIYHKGIAQHIGVYIGENQIVHASDTRDIVIDDMRFLQIEGFYEVLGNG